jgi:hypothetical protein
VTTRDTVGITLTVVVLWAITVGLAFDVGGQTMLSDMRLYGCEAVAKAHGK